MPNDTIPPPERSCTCHPDDSPPVPCPKKYAFRECVAHAAAVSAADNAALRESIDELESLCSAKQSEIDALRKLYHSQTGRVKVLEDALRGVLPWVVTQEVACNGLKCREAVCMSCDSDSEANTQLACDAYAKASNALEQKL